MLASEKNTVLVGEMLVEETPEEEFGLVEGPLGHSPDEMMDERFFNTALWEAETFQMTLAI